MGTIGDIIFQIIAFGLTILFFISFGLFINRLLRNQKRKIQDNIELEKKLDKIISLLEEKESKN
jgi:uncharacterized protein YneF (UPF0154 family)